MKKGFRVEGEVVEGFESVRDLFQSYIERGTEDKAQLCVYHDGIKVVDLIGEAAGSMKNGPRFTGDSLIPLISSSKTLSSIAFACLVDRGHIAYDTPVVQVWPEFNLIYRDNLTLADVLRHEAGLTSFKATIPKEDITIKRIKENSVGSVIEGSMQVFPPSQANTNREYHGNSRGMILNEIFRRAEPEGRTIGEFLRAEIADPLGIDVRMGVKKEEISQIQPMTTWGTFFVLFQAILPGFLGRLIVPTFSDFLGLIFGLLPNIFLRIISGIGFGGPEVIEGVNGQQDPINYLKFFEDDFFRMGEVPSLNGMSSARGLAKLGATLLNGGVAPDSDVRIISEEGYKRMVSAFKNARDFGLPKFNTFFSQGGVNWFKIFPEDTGLDRKLKSLRENFVGWFGTNGSVFQWQPELGISFAYIPTRVHWYDPGNQIAGTMQREVVKCVQAMRGARRLRY